MIALSSGEVEYCGMVRGVSLGLGAMSLLADYGVSAQVNVNCGSPAAIGVARWRGLGTGRHIELSQLWLHEEVNNTDTGVGKVNVDNVVDALTKRRVDGHNVQQHMEWTRYAVESGRRHMAPARRSKLSECEHAIL